MATRGRGTHVWMTNAGERIGLIGQNDTALVNVTVLNVNDGDPSFGADRYEFVVDAAEVRGYVDAAAAAPPAPLLIGHVTVRDADGDRVHLQLTGADARYGRLPKSS